MDWFAILAIKPTYLCRISIHTLQLFALRSFGWPCLSLESPAKSSCLLLYLSRQSSPLFLPLLDPRIRAVFILEEFAAITCVEKKQDHVLTCCGRGWVEHMKIRLVEVAGRCQTFPINYCQARTLVSNEDQLSQFLQDEIYMHA
jgi:hypothetical protein